MKSYEEMTKSVLERGDRYFRRKEKRIAAVKKGVPIMSIFGIFTLVGLSLFNAQSNGDTKPDIPQQIEIVETQDETQTETEIYTETETSVTSTENTEQTFISTTASESTFSVSTTLPSMTTALVTTTTTTITTAPVSRAEATSPHVMAKETLASSTASVSTAVSQTVIRTETVVKTDVSINGENPSSNPAAIYTGTIRCEDGSNITWTYNDETRTMVFSGTGRLPDNVNTEETPEWKSLDTPYRAIHVVFEEGITGADWFEGYFCDPDVFGDETGSLTIADSVSIDKTFWQLLHASGVYDKITFHGIYGSSSWSFAPIDRFIGEGYSENPVLNITGETSDGAFWTYTYENAVLHISGNGTANSTDFGQMPFEKSRFVVLGKNLKLPESEMDRTSLFMRFFAMGEMYRSNQEIVIYAGSPARTAYTETITMLQADGEKNIEPKYPYTLINGDVNGDGSINCADATEILSVYSNMAVGGIDNAQCRKQILCNVNNNGIVDIADATLVLETYAKSAANIN